METVVVYDSKFGNTRRVAESIAAAAEPHGGVRLLDLGEVPPDQLGAIDLLIIGGPTQLHGLSPRMRQFTDELAAVAGNRVVAATFDTRYRMASPLSGSAAKQIAKRLKRTGIQRILEPQSFFVSRQQPPQLEAGELERAAIWAQHLANICSLSHWCAA